MRMIARSLLTGLLLGATVSCGVAKYNLVQQSVETADRVRVTLHSVDNGILTFEVFNLTNSTLVVDRDKFQLETPKGRIARVPGGVANLYNLPPGGAHDVRVRFPLAECAGDEGLKVVFDGAFLERGVPVPIAGLPLRCNRDANWTHGDAAPFR